MKNKKGDAREIEKTIVGDKISFEATEAYNLLRTNISLSFSDEGNSRVIGVTSTMRSEGKSVTSANLAYSFASMGKNVLLLECDLRLPSLSKHMVKQSHQGLSNILSGLCRTEEAIQELKDNLHFICAGDIPPNPSELLGGNRMSSLIDEFKEQYDYVILDLPPVNIVSDALVVGKVMDGMLMIVRRGVTQRKGVAKMVRHLEFAGIRIIGFVFNDSTASDKSKYYKNYEQDYRQSSHNSRRKQL